MRRKKKRKADSDGDDDENTDDGGLEAELQRDGAPSGPQSVTIQRALLAMEGLADVRHRP